MIGQTICNLQSGGRLRVAGVVASVVLFVTALALPVVLAALPLGALAGILILIIVDTGE